MSRRSRIASEKRRAVIPRRNSMATWTPDPTFYPSPKLAMTAPRETLAYVAVIDPERRRPDALAVLDVDPQSAAYGQVVGRLALPYAGDALPHFGWNAFRAALWP